MIKHRAILAVLMALPAVSVAAQVTEPREGVSFFDTGPLRIEEQFLLSAGFLNLAPPLAAGRGTRFGASSPARAGCR